MRQLSSRCPFAIAFVKPKTKILSRLDRPADGSAERVNVHAGLVRQPLMRRVERFRPEFSNRLPCHPAPLGATIPARGAKAACRAQSFHCGASGIVYGVAFTR